MALARDAQLSPVNQAEQLDHMYEINSDSPGFQRNMEMCMGEKDLNGKPIRHMVGSVI